MDADQKSQHDDFFSERSLWDIWRKAKTISYSRFNCYVICSFAIIWALDLGFSSHRPREVVEFYLRIAELGWNSCLNILAFLLAGFTIFATVTKPELFLFMSSKEKQPGLSYLKYNFFVFYRVFVLILVFLALCLFILLFGQPNGVIWRCLGNAYGAPFFKFCLPRILCWALGVGLMMILLELKSFVFNIYHIVMTALRWEKEKSGVINGG